MTILKQINVQSKQTEPLSENIKNVEDERKKDIRSGGLQRPNDSPIKTQHTTNNSVEGKTIVCSKVYSYHRIGHKIGYKIGGIFL